MSVRLPSVIVIIPSRDGMPYLRDAVESVLNQHVIGLSLLVLDGESQDDSTDYLSSIQDPRLAWISTDRNLTPAARRNVGAQRTKDDVLMFLDSDDILEPDSITNLLGALTDLTNQIVIGGLRRFVQDETQRQVQRLNSVEFGPAVGTVIIPRNVYRRVGALNESLMVGEFIEWMTRARRLEVEEVRLDSPVLRRREHSDNRSRRFRNDYQTDLPRIIRSHLEGCKESRRPTNCSEICDVGSIQREHP